jgi:hypothetical protein
VRHGAVAAQVAIPPIGFRIEVQLLETAIETIEPLLAL